MTTTPPPPYTRNQSLAPYKRLTHDINKTDKRTSNRQSSFDQQQTELEQTDKKRWIETCKNRPMTADKLYTRLSDIYTIKPKPTIHFQRTRLITSSTDKHHSLDSEDDFSSGRRNVSQQQQFFSEIPSPTTTTITALLT